MMPQTFYNIFEIVKEIYTKKNIRLKTEKPIRNLEPQEKPLVILLN